MRPEIVSQLDVDLFGVDWALNLRAALENCEAVYVFPDEITVCPLENGERLSFVHGVPGASGLAGVNFAHDKRKRRALMERAGVRVPKGATFSFGSGKVLAKRFAAELGYPVVLKPALGDNGVDAAVGIRSEAALEEALEALSLPPDERQHHVQSAYRMFLIDEPKRKNGKVTVPGKYKFLVEKHVTGDLFRVLVAGSKILSALRLVGSPSAGGVVSARDVTGSLPESVSAVALDAAGAVPGMAVCAVDVVLPARRFRRSRRPVVVDYHERPGLWVQALAGTELAIAAADGVWDAYASAGGNGAQVLRQDTSAGFNVEIEGLSDAKTEAGFLLRQAKKFGVLTDSLVSDSAAGTVSAEIEGRLLDIVAVVHKLLTGDSGRTGAPLVVLRKRRI